MGVTCNYTCPNYYTQVKLKMEYLRDEQLALMTAHAPGYTKDGLEMVNNCTIFIYWKYIIFVEGFKSR